MNLRYDKFLLYFVDFYENNTNLSVKLQMYLSINQK